MADMTLCVSKKCPIIKECGRHISNRDDVNEFRQAICDFFGDDEEQFAEPFFCEDFFQHIPRDKYGIRVRGVVGNITRQYMYHVLAGPFTLDKVMIDARVAQFNYTPANAKIHVGIDKMFFELIKRGKFPHFARWDIFEKIGYNPVQVKVHTAYLRRNYTKRVFETAFLDLDL